MGNRHGRVRVGSSTQISARDAVRTGADRFRCSLAYDATAGHAPDRTHVDEVIRIRNHIKSMFDYHDGRTRSCILPPRSLWGGCVRHNVRKHARRNGRTTGADC